jgi:NADPH:quinone reductase-like Zn-dependent oxidoreductase
VDYKTTRFEDAVPKVDAVLDLVGGETQRRSFAVLKPGGILVSVVSPFPEESPAPAGLRTAFFLVEVTTSRLNTLTELFDSGKLMARVGTVPPLAEARRAHEMLGGAPHKRGKIVLSVSTPA